MGNYEKKAGLPNRKLIPDLEPSRCVTQPKPPKKAPKLYEAQRWWKGWGRWPGDWHAIGSSNNIEEARHLMKKPAREFWRRFDDVDVRIVNTQTGEVVEKHRLHATEKPQ